MKVEVTKQAVTVTQQSVICEGDYCVNECILDLPECFNGLSVTAVFNNIPVPVTDGKCIIPSLKKGNGVLGVYAYKKDSGTDELKLMYSPEPCVFWVSDGSYTEEVTTEKIPEISRYEEYCNMLREYCTEYLDKVSFENEEELKKCEKLIHKVTSLSESSTDEEYPTAKAVYEVISAFQRAAAEELLKCEKAENKTEALSEESTNKQYPTAKAVYDFVEKNTSQQFDPESEKPQSGIAVAQAVALSDGTRFSNALKGKESGTAVRIDDVSSETHYPVITVRNKNLWVNFIADKQYANGSKLTVNGDGSVTIHKVAGDMVSLKTEIHLSAGTYTISSGEALGSGGYIYVLADGEGFLYSHTPSRKTATRATDFKARLGLYIPATDEFDTTIYPQLKEGAEETEYTPYVELDTVNISRYGKNLADFSKMTNRYSEALEACENGVVWTAGNDYYCILPCFIPANLTVILNCVAGNTAGESISFVHFYYSDGTGFDRVSLGQSITLTKNIDKIYLYKSSPTVPLTEDLPITRIQLELGDTATDYEPYKEVQTLSPDGNGNVNGLESVYPCTTLLTDTDGITINAEYNRDINKAFAELQQAIISLGGNV